MQTFFEGLAREFPARRLQVDLADGEEYGSVVRGSFLQVSQRLIGVARGEECRAQRRVVAFRLAVVSAWRGKGERETRGVFEALEIGRVGRREIDLVRAVLAIHQEPNR